MSDTEFRFTFLVQGEVGMPGATRDQAEALVQASLEAQHPSASVQVDPVVDDTTDITQLDEEVTA